MNINNAILEMWPCWGNSSGSITEDRMKFNGRTEIIEYDDSQASTIKEDLTSLRTTIEQKLEMYHEGTVVHTQYTLFLEEVDKILEGA
jgi:hypothetical protein